MTKTYTLYSIPKCPWCEKAGKLLEKQGVQFTEVKITNKEKLLQFASRHSIKTMPQIFLEEERIGGYTELVSHFAG